MGNWFHLALAITPMMLRSSATTSDAPAFAAPSPPPRCSGQWHRVPAPDPDPDGVASLDDVAVITSDDAWAVGGAEEVYGGDYRTLAMHWDGAAWAIVPTPSGPGDRLLTDVDALSTNDVWAVGHVDFLDPLVLHWDGEAWTVVEPPSAPDDLDILTGVAAIAADNVWAIGMDGVVGAVPYALNWNGQRWKVVPFPMLGKDTHVWDLTAVSADDLWAVGSYRRTINTPMSTFTAHWDGATWTAVETPTVQGADLGTGLWGVDARASDDVWAVGTYFTFDRDGNVALHWDGSRWRMDRAAGGSDFGVLISVTAQASDHVWAVGYSAVSGQPHQTLAVEWDGVDWREVRTPTQLGSVRRHLNSTDALGNLVWAVGSDVFGDGSVEDVLIERICS